VGGVVIRKRKERKWKKQGGDVEGLSGWEDDRRKGRPAGNWKERLRKIWVNDNEGGHHRKHCLTFRNSNA